MIFLSFLGCIIVFLKTKPKVNVLGDPATMFFVGLLYYGFLIPIAITLSGLFYIPFLDDELVVSPSDISAVSFVLFFGYLAFMVGYRLITPSSYVDEMYGQARRGSGDWSRNGGPTITAMVAISLLICVAFYRTQLLDVVSGYEGKIQARYESSIFVFVYSIFLLSLTAAIAWRVYHAKKWKLYFGGSLVIFVMLAITTFSKDALVFAGLISFAAASRAFPDKQMPIFVSALFAAGLILIFFVPAFSIYRATGELAFVNPKDVALPFLFSDANGPFATLILAIKDGAAISLGPLFESFFLWIPRGIWTDRPLDAAENFARAVMPDWQPGHGLGFSPFAEGITRFGIYFSPLLMLLMGTVISYLQKLILRRVSPALVPALLLVIQGYLMFALHRGAFSGIFTTLSQFWLPFLGISVGLRALSDSRAGSPRSANA